MSFKWGFLGLRQKNFLKHGGVFFSSNLPYTVIYPIDIGKIAGMANNIEIYSVDEAFLDLENMNLENSDIADEFAMHCRSLIKQWVGIPVLNELELHTN